MMLASREGNTQERENQFDQHDPSLQDVEYSIESCASEDQLKENVSNNRVRRKGDACEKSVLHSIMSQSPTVQLIDFLIDVVRDDLNGPPEEYLDALGRTPLHLAVSAGCDISVIQRLLIGNRSVQIVDLDKRYPLHYACSSTLVADNIHSAEYNNMVSIITTLLWAYPKALSCQDIEGNTPLDVAKKICAGASVLQILDSYHRKMLSPSSTTPTRNAVRIAPQQKELLGYPTTKTMFPDNVSGKKISSNCKDSNKSKKNRAWNPPPSTLNFADTKKITDHNSSWWDSVPYIKTDGIDNLFDSWSSLPQSSSKGMSNSINSKMELRPSISSNGDGTADTHELTSSPGMSLSSLHSSSTSKSFCLKEVEKAVDDFIGSTSDEEKHLVEQELDDSVRSLKDVVIPALYQGGVHRQMPNDTIRDPWTNDKHLSFTDPMGNRIRNSRTQQYQTQESNRIRLPIVSVRRHESDDDDCSSIGLFSAHMNYKLKKSKKKFGGHHHPAPDYERMEL